MKNSIIVMLVIGLIGSLILNFATFIRNNKPNKNLAEEGIVRAVAQEDGNNYKYEIITEDGNLWETYGDGYEKVGDNLIVIFDTSNSSNCKEWEIINFWKTSDRE